MEQSPSAAASLHVPVMLQRCVDLLAPGIESALANSRTPVVVDATLGMGGHSEALLSQYPQLHLVGIDRDTQALELASERLQAFEERTDLVHAVYDELDEILDDLGIEYVDGILMDLGVSSLQLDEHERGFAYSFDAPLDMRMDATTGPSAADLVNSASEDDLRRIIQRWGEEKFAWRIAKAIVARRSEREFSRTGDLVEVIRSVVPAAAARTGGHPAKRTFQALRIEVNRELAVLESAVPQAVDALAIGGRAVIMSYHSLEDKIVKSVFSAGATSLTPPGFPVELEEHKPELRILTRGTVKPTPEEILENPRAASAKLRAVERIRSRRAL